MTAASATVILLDELDRFNSIPLVTERFNHQFSYRLWNRLTPSFVVPSKRLFHSHQSKAIDNSTIKPKTCSYWKSLIGILRVPFQFANQINKSEIISWRFERIRSIHPNQRRKNCFPTNNPFQLTTLVDSSIRVGY